MNDRDLDKLIAENIFNYTVVMERRPDGQMFILGGLTAKQPVPHYSKSISEAWAIVDKLKQEDQYTFTIRNGDLSGYECIFTAYGDEIDSGSAESDNPAKAICLAALKVFRVI